MQWLSSLYTYAVARDSGRTTQVFLLSLGCMYTSLKAWNLAKKHVGVLFKFANLRMAKVELEYELEVGIMVSNLVISSQKKHKITWSQFGTRQSGW